MSIKPHNYMLGIGKMVLKLKKQSKSKWQISSRSSTRFSDVQRHFKTHAYFENMGMSGANQVMLCVVSISHVLDLVLPSLSGVGYVGSDVGSRSA